MNQRSHAFSSDEAPTTPARRGALRELAAASSADEDEAPTTLRRSSTVRARPAVRPTPPPLPPTLPRPVQVLRRPSPPPLPPRASMAPTRPPPLPSTPSRPPIRSLASVLEPTEVPDFFAAPSRDALVPPDPQGFCPEPAAPATTKTKRKAAAADSTRWLVRIALVLVLLAEELLLAAPTGALHPPRDVSEAGTMVFDAIRGSAIAALEH